MRHTHAALALAGVATLAACAVAPPAGPSVMALPGDGKDFARFQQDDQGCRGYAGVQTGNASPAAAAGQTAVGSAAIGTLLGAAAGAAIGAAAGNPGLGAAIGAGGGLAVGAGNGSANAAAVGGDLQSQYDIAYTQCMYANGNKVVSQPPGSAYASGYAYPGYYGPGYGYGYGYAPPVIGFGFGGGYGWRGGYHDGWRGGYHGGWRR